MGDSLRLFCLFKKEIKINVILKLRTTILNSCDLASFVLSNWSKYKHIFLFEVLFRKNPISNSFFCIFLPFGIFQHCLRHFYFSHLLEIIVAVVIVSKLRLKNFSCGNFSLESYMSLNKSKIKNKT